MVCGVRQCSSKDEVTTHILAGITFYLDRSVCNESMKEKITLKKMIVNNGGSGGVYGGSVGAGVWYGWCLLSGVLVVKTV